MHGDVGTLAFQRVVPAQQVRRGIGKDDVHTLGELRDGLGPVKVGRRTRHRDLDQAEHRDPESARVSGIPCVGLWMGEQAPDARGSRAAGGC